MFDLALCRSLVRRWPVTIERYDSGQVGFVARPTRDGRRHNASFSTSKYASPEKAAEAAIAFCKEVDQGLHAERLERRRRHPIPANILPDIAHLVTQAIGLKMDPVQILRDGISARIQKRLESGRRS
jgi:hypothetical protein